MPVDHRAAVNIGRRTAALGGLAVGLWAARGPARARAQCPPERELAAWLAEWDRPEDVARAFEEAHALSTLWVRSLTLTLDGTSVRFAETPAMIAGRKLLGRRRDAGPLRYGPVLHNAGPQGFDAELGRRLLARPGRVIEELVLLARRERWTSINVDLESLASDQAAAFERFLDRLLARLRGTDVRLSVDLHPRTGARETYEGAAFQRWPALAERKLDFVIMAYDHAWATSPPGPIAPLGWTLEVMAYAASTLPPERTVFALPLYGYAWRREASPDGAQWQGTPELAPALRSLVEGQPGWTRDGTLGRGDGHLFRRGTEEAIAFDDTDSALAKMEALSLRGARRFAVWRLGARISLAPFRTLLPVPCKAEWKRR